MNPARIPLAALSLAATALLVWIPAAEADHYAGGTVSLVNAGEDTVQVNAHTVWMYSEHGGAGAGFGVGDLIDFKPLTSTYLHFGDGSSPLANEPEPTDMRLLVTSINVPEDMFTADVMLPDGSPITYQYDPKVQSVYRRVMLDTSNRREQDHVNNPQSFARITSATWYGGNGPDVPATPVIDHPMLIVCGHSLMCRFDLDATDPGGLPLEWRLSSSAEANANTATFRQPGPPFSASAMTMDPDGAVVWPTYGIAFPGTPQYFSMHATVSAPDFRMSSIDLLVKIIAPTPMSVEYTQGPCDDTLEVPAGYPLTFPLAAAATLDGHLTSLEIPSATHGLRVVGGDPAEVATGTLEWDSVPEGMSQVTVLASSPGNNTVVPAESVCRVNIRGLPGPEADLVPSLMSSDNATARFRLTDMSRVPGHLQNVTYYWTVDGAFLAHGTSAEVVLPEGMHEACIHLNATFMWASYTDKACGPLRVTVPVEDRDKDGVRDVADNCPGHPNRGQEDKDDDGFGDVCDLGDRRAPDPRTASDPGGDNDLDGIANDVDLCIDVPDPAQVDGDHDGTGDACDADLDGDDVSQLDGTDNCPQVPNPEQTDSDADGAGDACDAVGAMAAGRVPAGAPAAVGDTGAVPSSEPRGGVPIALGIALLAVAAVGLLLLTALLVRQRRRA